MYMTYGLVSCPNSILTTETKWKKMHFRKLQIMQKLNENKQAFFYDLCHIVIF